MSHASLSEHIIVNGRLAPHDQAHISLYSQALFSSFGVYESIRIEGGAAFHLDDHLGRLLRSAEMLELPLPYSSEDLHTWIELLIKTDQITESLLRILVFGPNGDEECLAYVLPTPLPRYPEGFYTAGATAITFEGTRPLPQAKTLNTLVNYLALRRARRAGAHEAVLVNPEDCLTEGSRSNLFVLAGDTLMTPPASQVIAGITRDLVWKLAEARGVEVVESPIRRNDLAGIDEMFVTSTSMHVIPIVQIDDSDIGAGDVGATTRMLMADFEDYYARVMGYEAVTMVPAI